MYVKPSLYPNKIVDQPCDRETYIQTNYGTYNGLMSYGFFSRVVVVGIYSSYIQCVGFMFLTEYHTVASPFNSFFLLGTII